MPKKPIFTYCPGLLTKEEVYYTPKDLILGNYVYVYGRPCHIVDCDEFTRKWYKDNLGVEMNPIKVKRNPPQRVIHPIPSHNGFGSEEDSLLSVFYLNPAGKVHEYYTKEFKRDKHILRFNAKLISPVPSDEERMKNPYTNRYYSEKDLMVGKTIYLNKYTFRLLECDEYTKKYMRDNAEIFRDSDCSEVIGRIRTAGNDFDNMDNYLVAILKGLDPENKGYISSDEILEGFKKFNLYLTTQELISLTDYLKKDENGNYSMEDLYNLIVCYK